MYFAYIDESGNPDPKDKDNKIYVLASVIMQEQGLNFLNNVCGILKQEIWQMIKKEEDSDEIPPKLEIHMDHICGGRGLFKSLKGDKEKWHTVANKIYSLIARLYIKIMGVIIVKEYFYDEYPDDDLTKWAFELLVERINRYVVNDSKNQEGKEYGLLVVDSVDLEADNEKRKQILEFMKRGTGHGWEEYPDNIINSPFIVSSELHNGVQIVDAVVYLIRWYTRKIYSINPNAFFHLYSEEFMNLIKKKFYRFPHISQNTIKFFPPSTLIPAGFWDIFK